MLVSNYYATVDELSITSHSKMMHIQINVTRRIICESMDSAARNDCLNITSDKGTYYLCEIREAMQAGTGFKIVQRICRLNVINSASDI